MYIYLKNRAPAVKTHLKKKSITYAACKNGVNCDRHLVFFSHHFPLHVRVYFWASLKKIIAKHNNGNNDFVGI